MNLYKIMIVDDEEEIRLGIIKKIDWEAYGFVVVGDAENGQDALEKAEKLQPDVIMTDIKMPYMDGLELGKKLVELMPSTKIIVFSGCDDFEYAHQAIKINVVEYVLKPINSVEFIEVLQRLKSQLDKEYDEKRNLETLYKHYVESLPVIREQFLVGMLEGRISGSQWKDQSENLGIDFKYEYISVALIRADGVLMLEDNKDSADAGIQKEPTLVPISIKKMVDETMDKYTKFVSFIYSDMVVVIGNLIEKNDILQFIKGINEICKEYMRIMDLNISAGIGYVYDDPSEMRFSYRSAQNALDYRFILGTGKAIYIDDVEPDNSIHLQLDEQEERVMLNAIKISSEEEITEAIDNLFKKFQDLLLPFNQYRIYLMEIMTSILKLVQNYNLDINEIFGENFNCYSYLEAFDSIDEVKKWITNKAIKINDYIKKERINSSMLLIEKAKQYIKESYSDPDVSVEKLCSRLHVSPTYFSTIFKKETGENFVNYLTTVRLEEAVKLLNTTDDKTYMIAEKVGYPEANYFSYVFKKKFGVSPSKYRKS
ncbi:two-component system response regulator YesN [Clostridium saccharoperbutylacetonicum]|uniref:Stage 0 sporulation protein A homolog n=1 Tax=Clostridium saccharoperbutylacetonicum N1-4(HMT) TaxID=931276 RepID=M1MQF5_9CLOT|nr:response regulator [Clostridium saccharoperbutylacetonicum]AGF58418.1 response regulator receiver protein [Clostridium saccharoperbutylacetonicum N1-4(HMT)]NRT60804.1 two-component system response regulator YesN [Clostridium saccharoperbutylacetonicum]NSB24118.1 two-component system response regulator YesN [Clostridium saccharoperbutylacetonicum]NSB43496.1 two-component system response regulator YesN [Clostridium saccharoperbutylacetonicum]